MTKMNVFNNTWYIFYHRPACTITWSFASGIMSQFCGRCHTVFCDVAL